MPISAIYWFFCFWVKIVWERYFGQKNSFILLASFIYCVKHDRILVFEENYLGSSFWTKTVISLACLLHLLRQTRSDPRFWGKLFGIGSSFLRKIIWDRIFRWKNVISLACLLHLLRQTRSDPRFKKMCGIVIFSRKMSFLLPASFIYCVKQSEHSQYNYQNQSEHNQWNHQKQYPDCQLFAKPKLANSGAEF